jgi:integrase
MNTMKNAYRLFQRKNRGGYYYIQNNQTGEQRSLGTTDKGEAKRLFSAENQANSSPADLNLQLGRVYIRNASPKMATRTWQEAMDEMSSHGKKESTQARCKREFKSKPYDIIRNKPIVQTTSDDLKLVLKRGGSATNNYLRRLHNLALGNGWIHWNIISPRNWGKPEKKPKRGVTFEEHSRIVAAEGNTERRHYYEMLWLIGAAQTDGATLTAEDVDLSKKVLNYRRRKTGEPCSLGIGSALAGLLDALPKQGPLFPTLATHTNKDRSAEFCRRCRLLDIKGISLHSYRYAWAERAYAQGYAERFAQAALGHKSRAVHHAYAKGAIVVCPALDERSPEEAKKLPHSDNGGTVEEEGLAA